jgi:predicted transcriptional regulator of viral defense system
MGRMPVLRRFPSDCRTKADAEQLQRLAERQFGVISRRQLLDCGLSGTMIARWVRADRLHRVHPHVYALGHAALSLDGRLVAAVLYGGDQAVLSHTTAAWVWLLVNTEPNRIHLTAPGRSPSLPGVRVHSSRDVEVVEHRGFPVTPVARTLVDIASMLGPRQVRRAVSEADYRGLLDLREIRNAVRRGRAGSRLLRTVLDIHLPQLAATFSVLEERFLELCECAGLPLPEVNAQVGRMRVDALWREQRLAVELDGGPAHGGAAAMKRDRERELALRARGFQVVRYTWDQVTRRPPDVISDLRRLLGL